jgi:hypothetical protein
MGIAARVTRIRPKTFVSNWRRIAASSRPLEHPVDRVARVVDDRVETAKPCCRGGHRRLDALSVRDVERKHDQACEYGELCGIVRPPHRRRHTPAPRGAGRHRRATDARGSPGDENGGRRHGGVPMQNGGNQ